MSVRTSSHRTIRMPPARAKQLALAATFLGLPDSESVIQNFISAGLMSLCDHSEIFKLALLRSADVDWDELKNIATSTCEAKSEREHAEGD
jgi:hypothetical protein